MSTVDKAMEEVLVRIREIDAEIEESELLLLDCQDLGHLTAIQELLDEREELLGSM